MTWITASRPASLMTSSASWLQTLDGLLDRLSASLRREQRFSAELSHELRTPLAKICAEAELALRREREPSAYKDGSPDRVAQRPAMSRTIDTLVAASASKRGWPRKSRLSDSARPAGAACDDLAESKVSNSP